MMDILRDVSGGIHPREMFIISSGRRTGKSYYAMTASMRINNIKFMKIAQSMVDDEPWFSVIAVKETAEWLRNQDKTLSIETNHDSFNGTPVFDIHEKIYSMLVLKFQ